jgi:hypothetical protein
MPVARERSGRFSNSQQRRSTASSAAVSEWNKLSAATASGWKDLANWLGRYIPWEFDYKYDREKVNRPGSDGGSGLPWVRWSRNSRNQATVSV